MAPSPKARKRVIGLDICAILVCASLCLAVVVACATKAASALVVVMQDDVGDLRVPVGACAPRGRPGANAPDVQADIAQAQQLHAALKRALASAPEDARSNLWLWITLAFSSIYVFKQGFSVGFKEVPSGTYCFSNGTSSVDSRLRPSVRLVHRSASSVETE